MPRFSCLLIVLMTASARGDEPKPAPPVSPVRTLLDVATEVKARAVADLVKEYERMDADHLSGVEKEVREKAIDDQCDLAVTPSFDRLLEAASEKPDDPASVEALQFILINARGLTTGQVARALVLLKRDHIRDRDISIATEPLWLHHDKPEAVAFLRAVIADNPNRIDRGRACHDLAALMRYRADSAERVRKRSPGVALPARWAGADLSALRTEAAEFLDRCVAEFADVPMIEHPEYAASIGKTVGDFARGELFELRRLQVGMQAPEITGQDIDGNPLRLGDYRGKVVVLVFSGEWCGPCKQAAKHFRDMLKPEAQKSNPCVILEVNTDTTREAVRKAIGAGDMIWPCWFDGSTAGPITLAWGVSSFPTIYVLDARGVIRAKDIRGEATADAVAEASKVQRSAVHP